MAEQPHDKEIIEITIEQNVSKGFGILPIAGRNVIEAILFTGIVISIICHINFTNIVKGFYLLIFGIGIFVSVLRGYKNRSFTQIAVDYIVTLKNRKVLHLRGPEYVRQEIKLKDTSGSDKTYAEQSVEWGKARLHSFIEKYSDEESR